MKKTFALCLSLALVGVFFLFPVNAASTIIATRVNATGITYTGTGGNFTLTGSGMLMYPETNTSLEGGVTQNVIVNLHFDNRSSDDIYLQDVYFALTLGANGYVQGWSDISHDLYIRTSYNGRFYVGAGESLGYQNGFIIPSGAAVDLVAVVDIEGTYNTTTGPVSIGLSSIATSIGQYNFGTYAHGEAADLSAITSYLDNVDDNLIDILTLLTDNTAYSGSHYSYAGTNATYVRKQENSVGGLSGYNIICSRFTGIPYLISEDVSYFNDSDDFYADYTVRHPFFIYILESNNTGSAIITSFYHNFRNLFPNLDNVGGSIHIERYESTLFYDFYPATVSEFYIRSISGNPDRSYVPEGRFVTTIRGYIDLPRGKTISWLDPDITNTQVVSPQFYDGYVPDSEFTVLEDIYKLLTTQDQSLVDKSDDVAQDSDTVAEQIDYVHQQEMAFFEANEEAIEATGLSNFHYNQNTISAFTMITNQFASVWNALSDYTLVFIFTLLLSLATFIIRHEPTTKMKQYRTSVAAERAERISYYGRMNAQSRASARNDGDSYFWDAVRRNNM